METTINALLEQEIDKLISAGYKPVSMMFDLSENIYRGFGFSKGNLDLHEPYKGNRHAKLEESNSWVVTYAFDQDSTMENSNGTFIYDVDEDNYDEDDEIPEINAEKYEVIDKDELLEAWADSLPSQQILDALKEILAVGENGRRWFDISLA